MAINPNSDFSVSGVLTAAQQNRFPRGVMAFNSTTTTDSTITAEEVQITGSSFTAVASRYYRITYFEPNLYNGNGNATGRIRLTNLAGTQLQQSLMLLGATVDRFMIVVWVGTLTAGTTNVVATQQCASGTGYASRASTYPAYIVVEDIGPA